MYSLFMRIGFKKKKKICPHERYFPLQAIGQRIYKDFTK